MKIKKSCLMVMTLLLTSVTSYFAFAADMGKTSCFSGHDLLAKESIINSEGDIQVLNGVSVPHDFPQFEVHQYGQTAPGRIFTSFNNYLMILNNDGSPYYYLKKEMRNDFQQQITDDLSFVRGGCRRLTMFFLMNDNFEVFDSLEIGDNHQTGGHEVIVLPDGHSIFVEWDTEPKDMSQVVSGGNKYATLFVENIIELDENKNIVFTWKGSDHYDLLDLDNVNLKDQSIDFGHINSMSVDYDSNLVISNRYFSEVTKINRKTGEVMWRLGGKKSTFQFTNDSVKLSYQHTARPVPNKPNYYTIFDNGNTRDPQYSRAVEYKLDVQNNTAEKIWEYRPAVDYFASAQGSVQRLTNGNTLINWGFAWSEEREVLLTEVSPDNEVVYEITGQSASRSHRYEWEGIAQSPYLLAEPYDDHLALLFNQFGAKNIANYNIYGDTQPNPTKLLKTTTTPYVRLLPSDFDQDEAYWYFQVTSVDSTGKESSFSNQVKIFVYFIDPTENMLFNGDFSKDITGWELVVVGGHSANGNINNEGQYHINITNSGSYLDLIKLAQKNIRFMQGASYQLEFDAHASSPKTIETKIGQYFIKTHWLTTSQQHFSHPITFENDTDFNGYLEFRVGLSNADVYLDNVVLKNISTAVDAESSHTSPQTFQLMQNYPNPFNPSTTIKYHLSKPGNVILKIYNLSGQELETLVNGFQDVGEHAITWQPEGLPSGIYFYKLQAGEYSEIKKLILQK